MQLKSHQILHVWPNFLGGVPKFWDLHYKIQSDIDHVAKFNGDRPRELGDRVAKFKKNRNMGQSPT